MENKNFDWNDTIEKDGTKYQDEFVTSRWWTTEKTEALKMYGSRCHCCHSEVNLSVHHKSYEIKNQLDQNGFNYDQAFDRTTQYRDLWNLDVLCQPCHDLYHKAQQIMFRLLWHHDPSIRYYEDIISLALYKVFPNGWAGKYPIVFVKLLMDKLRAYIDFNLKRHISIDNRTRLTFSGIQYGSIVKNAKKMRESYDRNE